MKKQCKRCGHEINPGAFSCLVCGHVQKKKNKKKLIIGILVICTLLYILGSQETANTDNQNETANTDNQNETANTDNQNETANTDNQNETANTDNQNETASNTNEEFDWKGVLSEFKLNDEQVLFAKELMNNVGIYDISLLDHTYTDCSVGLCAFRSTFRDENGIQINFTFEDGKLFYVQFTGIPGTKKELYVNWLGRLSVKTVNVSKAVDLYSDTQGGYLNYIDYENREIIDYKDKP